MRNKKNNCQMKTSESKAKTMELVLLGLGLLLVAGHCVPVTAAPSSTCQMQCGNVKILYPFGIGENCSMSGEFDVTCQPDKNGISKPFISGHELLDISLTNSTIRVLNPITTYCYNDTWHMNSGMVVQEQTDNSSGYSMVNNTVGIKPPFRFSDTRNKYTVIGCLAIGLISNTASEYGGGCVSVCSQNMSDGSSCLGTGCCQTPIPKGLDSFDINLLFSTTIENQTNVDKKNQTNGFGGLQCNYAVLMETAAFFFSPTYVNTTKFNDMDAGQAPVVLDWSIRNDDCQVAQRNLTGTYACLSANSMCVNSTSGSPGYVCNCSQGYEGNPYLQDGCREVDECKGRPCPSDGVCHNTAGGYRCSCRAGRKYSEQNKLCVLDTVLIIGVTMGCLALMIFCFCGYIILQKRKLKNIKQEYFRQHGGLILFDTMKSEKGLAFTVFSEAELIEATNNYAKSRIIGRGGHGIVYKGIVKGNMPVAIKRCTLIDERQKKEFGQEMLILSQINHKNIVKLVGCCLEVEVPMLVYEFIPNGTLFQLIHGMNETLKTSFSTLLRIAHEAAEGLSFLHSYASPPIIHGDVKTSNILLDENYTAKVSDFGASILAPSDKEQYVTLVQGTVGYLDPEYMQTCQLTEKSDVYSFGVILLEVLTGEAPLKLYGPEEKRSLTSNFLSAMKQNDLCAVVASHIKEQESIELIRGLGELAQKCIDICGSNRPSMKEVADELNRLRKLLLHPLLGQNTEEKETPRLLGGSADTSFQTENSIVEYPALESQNLPMDSVNSNYAR